MLKTPVYLQRTAAHAGISLCYQFYIIPKSFSQCNTCKYWSLKRTNWLVALVTMTHTQSSIHPRDLA